MAKTHFKERAVKLGLALALVFAASQGVASDHDDGENDNKPRSLNLTDLFAFRDDWHSGSKEGSDDLVLIMNTNPRSVARQQYYFSENARYEFHMSRVRAEDKGKGPKGKDDITIRFEFEAPDKTGHQSIKLTYIDKSKGLSVGPIPAGITTTLQDEVLGITNEELVPVKNHEIQIFAGMREDPFNFDVERYFQVRAHLAEVLGGIRLGSRLGPFAVQIPGVNPFRKEPVDFAAGYNVNSIVAKIPIRLLQTARLEPIYDVWETISVKRLSSSSGYLQSWINSLLALLFNGSEYEQIEYLAQPVINEGLVISNDLLNAFNRATPNQHLSATAVLNEAGAVLGLVNQYAASLGLNPPPVGIVVASFLPDVMRIDLRNNVGVRDWAYNWEITPRTDGPEGSFRLTSGRKILDETPNITLSGLFNGGDGLQCGPKYGRPCLIQAGTTYTGVSNDKLNFNDEDPVVKCSEARSGKNPANPGHQCLEGQTDENGSFYGPAKFPFLARPL